MSKGLINYRLFSNAKKLIPGGVNSPVRSFKSVGGNPLYFKRGKGAYIYDEGGRKYLDYCLSWGSLILGHTHPEVVKKLKEVSSYGTSFGACNKYEIELAQAIVSSFDSIEMVRLVNSGTEAVMSALRLARAFTGKNKIVKFDGCYHGHADYLLVKAGSGIATFGIAASPGVPDDFIRNTISLPYNNLELLEKTFKKEANDIAAIIVEPVMANSGIILPEDGFLQGLRKLCNRYNCLLIFDEVITGFRLSLGGAQDYFKVKADLTCLGKIIGAGLPIGAFGGRKEIMKLLAPEGDVYQAGTLSGNPITAAVGAITLKILKKGRPYRLLENRTETLAIGIRSLAEKYNIELKVNYIASIFSIFFTQEEVRDYASAQRQDYNTFSKFFHGLLSEGIYLSPSCFEANFLSIAHDDSIIELTLEKMDNVLKRLRR